MARLVSAVLSTCRVIDHACITQTAQPRSLYRSLHLLFDCRTYAKPSAIAYRRIAGITMTLVNNQTSIVAPIADIPFPKVDLARIPNPIPDIYHSAEFAATKAFFATSPSAKRSLLTDVAQALLYAVVRNLQPNHVVEIGTYQAGTSEGLARALHANGHGTLHTASPFDAERFSAILPHWPPELKQYVRYHQLDSMALFMQLDSEAIRPDLVLIDGNHDYEFANFDIQASARRLNIGGFMFVDNVSQAGPYFASRDFIARHPEWIDCRLGDDPPPSDSRAFDYYRTKIPGTDFFVLRSPVYYTVGNRPTTFGELPWSDKPVSGVRLSLQRQPASGTLYTQCILRGFSEARNMEVIGESELQIDERIDEIDISLAKSIVTDGGFDRYKVEPWLAWQGPDPLALRRLPIVY